MCIKIPHQGFDNYLRSMSAHEFVAFNALPIEFRLAIREAWDRGELEDYFQKWKEERRKALAA